MPSVKHSSTDRKVQVQLLAAEHEPSQNKKALLTGPGGQIWHIELLEDGTAGDLQSKINDIKDLFNEIFTGSSSEHTELRAALMALPNGESLDIQEKQAPKDKTSLSRKTIEWSTEKSTSSSILTKQSILPIWNRLFHKNEAATKIQTCYKEWRFPRNLSNLEMRLAKLRETDLNELDEVGEATWLRRADEYGASDEDASEYIHPIKMGLLKPDPKGFHSRLHVISSELALLLSKLQSETPQDSHLMHFEWAALQPCVRELFQQTLNKETLSIFQRKGHLSGYIEQRNGVVTFKPIDGDKFSRDIGLPAEAERQGQNYSSRPASDQITRSLLPTPDNTHQFGMRTPIDIASFLLTYLQTNRLPIALPPPVASSNLNDSIWNVWDPAQEHRTGVGGSGNASNLRGQRSLPGTHREQSGWWSELLNVFARCAGHTISIGLNDRPVAQRAPWWRNPRAVRVIGLTPESRGGTAPAVSPHLEQPRRLTPDQAAQAAQIFRSINPLLHTSSSSQPLSREIIDRLKEAAVQPQHRDIKIATLQEARQTVDKFMSKNQGPTSLQGLRKTGAPFKKTP